MAYKCTRLNLNWQLDWRDERINFINSYLNNISFTPNSQELDMMSKYILWGKDRKTGLNGRQEGLELETAAGTWDSKPIDSLDALIESPDFTESMLHNTDLPTYKIPKQTFSRAEARAQASPTILSQLEELWLQIDRTTLLLDLYLQLHNQRKSPIPESLLTKFSPAEIKALTSTAASLTSTSYLSKKRYLVDLYQQQYTFKDSYSPTLYLTPTWNTYIPDQLIWDYDISVLPLGLPYSTPFYSKLFNPSRMPQPDDFTEDELLTLSKLLWKSTTSSLTFDFTNPTQLALLADFQIECADYSEALVNSDSPQKFESTLPLLLSLFQIYTDLTPLKDFQKQILQLKLQHFTNEQIQTEILKTYNKHYTLNYISTLYHGTILTQIAQTAKKHREVCENLFFPENFKTCIDCGRVLLRDNDNFMRKQKVKDGFDCRCKQCARIKRNQRK